MSVRSLLIAIAYFEVQCANLSRPPDAHGYCSYGVSVDCTLAARKQARVVIAEVNFQMPRTLDRSFVLVSRLSHIVEIDRSLPEYVRFQTRLLLF